MIDHPSPNFGPRRNNGPIDILLLHYTEIDDLAGTLDILCDPKAEVSAHYVLDKDGTAYRLVAEDLRAWHAGQAFWAGSGISTAARSALKSSMPVILAPKYRRLIPMRRSPV